MSKAAEALKEAAVEYTKEKLHISKDTKSKEKKPVEHKPKAHVSKPNAARNKSIKPPKPAKVLVKKQVKSPMEKLIDSAKRGISESPPVYREPVMEHKEAVDDQQLIPFDGMLTQKPLQPPEHEHDAAMLQQPSTTLLSSTPPSKAKKEDCKPKTNPLMGMRPVGIGGYTLKKID